jgi:hypothetical protein
MRNVLAELTLDEALDLIRRRAGTLLVGEEPSWLPRDSVRDAAQAETE